MTVFAGPFSWPPDVRTFPELPLHDLNAFVAWTQSGCHVCAWRAPGNFLRSAYTVVDRTMPRKWSHLRAKRSPPRTPWF